jgi:hypothetical protein
MSDGLSIKERIALLKKSSAGASDQNVEPSPSSSPQRTAISDKIAALKQSAPSTPSSTSHKAAETSTPSAVTDENGSATAENTPVRRNSVADRIAAMQSTGSNNTPAPPSSTTTPNAPARRLSVSDKIAALQSSTIAPVPILTTPNSSSKGSTIADKIAALKAAPGSGTPQSSPRTVSAADTSRKAGENTNEADDPNQVSSADTVSETVAEGTQPPSTETTAADEEPKFAGIAARKAAMERSMSAPESGKLPSSRPTSEKVKALQQQVKLPDTSGAAAADSSETSRNSNRVSVRSLSAGRMTSDFILAAHGLLAQD